MLERGAYAVDAGTNPYQKTWLSAAYPSVITAISMKKPLQPGSGFVQGQGLQSRLMTAQAMRAPALPVGWVV